MKKLSELYKEHTGKLSDKWEIYLNTYNDAFDVFRNKNVSMLEIGVQNGGSLEIWKKYFVNPKVLIGCDVNEDCGKLTYDDEEINVVIGDANSRTVKKSILNIEDEFDIVLDDGSHLSSDIIQSFFNYFPNIKDDGLYVIEDLHCSYWSQYEGGIYDPYSSISFFKYLIDIINYEHWYVDKSKEDLVRNICDYYNIDYDIDILSTIHSIEFVNSICIIKKSRNNLLGYRIRAGSEAIVSPETKQAGSTNIIVDQSNNCWSTIDSNPSEYYFSLKKELEKTQLELELVYTSSSWKITKPVRDLKRVLVKLKKNFFFILNRNNFIRLKTALYSFLLYSKKNGLIDGVNVYYAKAKHHLYSLIHYSRYEPFHVTKRRYKHWINKNEIYNLSIIKDEIKCFHYNPVISIVMPVYNVEVDYLVEAIESVRSQKYDKWELCISDDCSSNSLIREIIEEYANKDHRIKYYFRSENGHISENSNTALSISSGEWVALMDHDDKLSQYALYEVVKVLNDNPKCEFIYSDEDKINELNERYDPHFKCDFNLDLLYSQNYISHLGVYKRNILNGIGGFRKGFEGSQDYDLLLRYLKKIDINSIIHIKKVLYHWRAIAGSTALNSEEKSYTTDASIKALKDCFDNKLDVEKGLLENTFKINWPLHSEPKVSLIIPTYNGLLITKQAIESILNKTKYKNYEILLVDNNSDDPEALEYFEQLSNHSKVRLLKYPYPFNYSAINNFAVGHAEGDIIGLINNDIEVINSNWLTEMISLAIREDIGCVGAKLYYSDGRIQHAGIIAGIGGVAGHSHKYYNKDSNGYFSRLKLRQNMLAVTAACLLVRKSIYESLGGLNEKQLTIAFNDVDFCFKVYEAGYRNVWTPYAELYHHESITRGAEDNPEKIKRFNKEVNYMKRHWEHLISYDPYYSEHFSTLRDDFSIK